MYKQAIVVFYIITTMLHPVLWYIMQKNLLSEDEEIFTKNREGMNPWFNSLFSVASNVGLFSSPSRSLPVSSVHSAQIMILQSPQLLVLASIIHMLNVQINPFMLFFHNALNRSLQNSLSVSFLSFSFAMMLPKSWTTARSVMC